MTQYYIQDISRGFVGNSMVWWKIGDHGYTCDIKEAKKWTEEAADKARREADDLRMWPKKYIDERIQHHIDMQYCDYEEATSMAGKKVEKVASGSKSDVERLVSYDENNLYILVWNNKLKNVKNEYFKAQQFRGFWAFCGLDGSYGYIGENCHKSLMSLISSRPASEHIHEFKNFEHFVKSLHS